MFFYVSGCLELISVSILLEISFPDLIFDITAPFLSSLFFVPSIANKLINDEDQNSSG